MKKIIYTLGIILTLGCFTSCNNYDEFDEIVINDTNSLVIEYAAEETNHILCKECKQWIDDTKIVEHFKDEHTQGWISLRGIEFEASDED